MRKSCRILAFLALLSLGCSHDVAPTSEPVAPVVLTVEERTAIALDHAVAKWTDAVGWAPAVEHVRYDEPDSDSDRTMAMMNADTSTLVIVPVRIGDDQDRWNMTVMHELGHAYGLGHVDHPLALMNERPNTTACVHLNDALALEALLQVTVKPNCWD